MTAPRARRRRIGTAARLSAFLAVLLIAVLGATTVAMVRIFDQSSQRGATDLLAAEVGDFSASLRGVAPDGLKSAAVNALASASLATGTYLVVQVPGETRLGSVGSATLVGDPAVTALLAHPPTTSTTGHISVDGREYLTVTTPIRSGTATIGAVLIAQDTRTLRNDQRLVATVLVGEGLIALLPAIAAAYLLLRRLLGTVGRITTAAQTAAEGDLGRRVGDQGIDDEVGALASTFDDMLDRLSAAVEAQRRLLADVSHQMRTPLTVARGQLEVLQRTGYAHADEVDQTVTTVIRELDHLTTLTERLLVLGRTLEPEVLREQPLEVAPFLVSLLEGAATLADRRWRAGGIAPVCATVDADQLRGAILNLLENAAAVTAPGDEIRLGAAIGPGGDLLVTVDDAGPGIADEQIPVVLSRFGRSPDSHHRGSGLGLAIVAGVARAHGGTLSLSRSDLGGLRATVAIPARRLLAEAPHPVGTAS